MTTVSRPQRWDHPFDPAMQDDPEGVIDRLLQMAPWSHLRAGHEELIRKYLVHDARALKGRSGEIVVREGDYGSSAFFVLRGGVRVIKAKPGEGLSRAEEGKFESRTRGIFGALAQLWSNRREPEARPTPGYTTAHGGIRDPRSREDYVPILLSDIGAVLDRHQTARISQGQFFGEIAALVRSPRTATIFVEDEGTELLEIRWQGFRDLRKQLPRLKEELDELFRTRALRHHLRANPIFQNVGDTPVIREHLAAGRDSELFIDTLGMSSPREKQLELTIARETIRLRSLAETLGRDGSTRFAVFAGDLPPGNDDASNAALRTQVTQQACRHLQAPVLIIWQGVGGDPPLWQWIEMESTENLDVQSDLESHELTEEDHGAILRRIIRPIALEELGRQTEFQSYGDFEWSRTATRLEEEPVIAAEGQYPNGVYLIRCGFARVSRRINAIDRTVSYLGPPRAFGFNEVAHNWRSGQTVALQNTLRCLGYVDVVFVPTAAIEKFVLPSIPPAELPAAVVPVGERGMDPVKTLWTHRGLDRSTIELLVDHRFVNGTAAMVIDLDRCTRCDDCVRACAATHDGNPRFVRHGPSRGHLMLANACMHCADPVCMIGCPTGAISRESVGGQVVINDATCIGCATCASNCPYNNIRMVEIRSEDGRIYLDANNEVHRKATKCDLCIEQRGGPACQRACPHDALQRVDLTDVEALAKWQQQ
jgi:Fe-S-cluster-containing dehydrogenase component/CRP-like cAMP-binding protein